MLRLSSFLTHEFMGNTSMSKRMFKKLFIAVLAIGIMTCGIREDELRCEESVAHLVECCPGFDAKDIDCYYTESCESGNYYPAITIAESRCILNMDCPAIVSGGICERAQKSRRPMEEGDTSEAVCP